MSMTQILSVIRAFDDLLELAPLPGSDHPEISWGDHFFYCAPDGQVPRNRQPYATIITKNYPDDTGSRLDERGRWRLNIHVGATTFTDLVGHPPGERNGSGAEHSTTDTFLPHPLYGAYGWVCVVNPAHETTERALEALRAAHQADRRRAERRQSRSDASRND
jgi:hypothetical protein